MRRRRTTLAPRYHTRSCAPHPVGWASLAAHHHAADAHVHHVRTRQNVVLANCRHGKKSSWQNVGLSACRHDPLPVSQPPHHHLHIHSPLRPPLPPPTRNVVLAKRRPGKKSFWQNVNLPTFRCNPSSCRPPTHISTFISPPFCARLYPPRLGISSWQKVVLAKSRPSRMSFWQKVVLASLNVQPLRSE